MDAPVRPRKRSSLHSAEARQRKCMFAAETVMSFQTSAHSLLQVVCMCAGKLATIAGHMVATGVLVWVCRPIHCIAVSSGVC